MPEDLQMKTAELSGLPESGYQIFDRLTDHSREQAGTLAVRAAGAPDFTTATTEFATSAGATYGVPADAIVAATGAVLDGTAPEEVMAAAREALSGVATNLGLANGPVGDGDYLGAAGALIGAAAGGPIGALVGTLLGYLINAVARALSDDAKIQQEQQ